MLALALALDKTTPREDWLRARLAEKQYSTTLRGIARMIDTIVKAFDPTTQTGKEHIVRALNNYEKLISPWARAVAERMITDVMVRDKMAWSAASRRVGRDLGKEIAGAPVGNMLRQLMDSQVSLITSLPREAAERVHKLATEGMSRGEQSKDIAAKVYETGHVTKSRATTIARTEVARAHANITQARAIYIGSPGYVWRSVMDGATRPSHRKLNGKTFTWDAPPVSDPPDYRSHPGCIWNCRCYSEVILPDLRQSKFRAY